MELTLKQLLPIPLKDRLGIRASSIWQQEVRWGDGEHLFVQAPSGTGKTTLIHILYGLRKDYEGKVQWDSSILSSTGAEQLAALRTKNISVIFQDMRLFPELTAWENLEVKRRLTNTVTEEQVADWFTRLGLKDKKNSLAATLSYGEQQRVSIIRALMQPFDWLLMDEP